MRPLKFVETRPIIVEPAEEFRMNGIGCRKAALIVPFPASRGELLRLPPIQVGKGPHHRIAVCFVEWSGIGAQKLLIDWTVIGDAASAQQFAAQLAEAPRSFADRTSISGGIEFALVQLERAPFEGSRRTIDVSGDGTNNAGRDVKLARD